MLIYLIICLLMTKANTPSFPHAMLGSDSIAINRTI